MSIVFDKLAVMRHLESDGTFARPQAEKLLEAFHLAVQEAVATKVDVARIELRLEGVEGKLASMEARIEAKLEASLASMKVWFGGGLVVLFTALSAIRFFGH